MDGELEGKNRRDGERERRGRVWLADA